MGIIISLSSCTSLENPQVITKRPQKTQTTTNEQTTVSEITTAKTSETISDTIVTSFVPPISSPSVSDEPITDVPTTLPPVASTDNYIETEEMTFYTTETVNVRSGPGTQYKIYGMLPINSNVTSYAVSDGWRVIEFYGKKGYVCEEYLSEEMTVVDNKWAYFLINRENPLSKSYSFTLDEVQGYYSLDIRCSEYARRMIADAKADGIDLMVVSGYRSITKQQQNLESYIEKLISKGYSEIEATEQALREIAVPYTSEHNAGLALDILTEDWWNTHDDITPDFDTTEEYRWLQENAHKYGFIMRYQKEYEDVTGYIYEPWHYRFVGVYYAKKIKESGQPLEYFYRDNPPE